MTQREMFEKRAIENGASVIVSTPTELVFVSSNGLITTKVYFDNNGKFVDFSH